MKTLSIISLVLLASMCGSEASGPKIDNSLINKDPWAYDNLFIDVISIALVNSWTGESYYKNIGDKAWTSGFGPNFHSPCYSSDVPNKYLENPGLCRMAALINNKSQCNATARCSSFALDAEILRSAGNTRVISDALSNPCKVVTAPSALNSLTDPSRPDRMKLRNYRIHGLSYSATEAWSMLGCSSKNSLKANNIKIDRSGVVSFRF